MNIYSPPSHIVAPDFGDYFGAGKHDLDGYQKAEQAYIDTLKAWAKRLAPSSPIAGELVSLPYADGAALYIIIQSSGKHGIMTVPVGDAWRDGDFERYATVAQLKDMVARNRRFEKARKQLV
jgi:hypothetical protein